MSKHKKKKSTDTKNEVSMNKEESEEQTTSNQYAKGGLTINISITYNIGNKEFHVVQRAEGGAQINKDVGTNANQGGQNALDHSSTENDHSQFADGNGRSGIAGSDNDEAGGQQGIKVRDSIVKESIIKSVSEQGGNEVASGVKPVNEIGDAQSTQENESPQMEQ